MEGAGIQKSQNSRLPCRRCRPSEDLCSSSGFRSQAQKWKSWCHENSLIGVSVQTVHLLSVSMHRGQRLPACILQNATPSCTLLLQYLACQTYHIGLHQVVLVWRLCVGMCCPTHGYVNLYENDDGDLRLVPLLTEYSGKRCPPLYPCTPTPLYPGMSMSNHSSFARQILEHVCGQGTKHIREPPEITH